MNINGTTVKKLENQIGPITFFKGSNVVKKEDATELSILYNKDGDYVGIKFKASSKKEVTFEDVIATTVPKTKNKADANVFKNLSSLCWETEHTSYGLSLCTMHPDFNSNQNKVDATLKKLNIEFKKEYSDSRLVLRYKINKKELSKI